MWDGSVCLPFKAGTMQKARGCARGASSPSSPQTPHAWALASLPGYLCPGTLRPRSPQAGCPVAMPGLCVCEAQGQMLS